MAVLYDPGQARPPAWASLLGNLKVMENGSSARMSTQGPPWDSLLLFFQAPVSYLLPPPLPPLLVT